MGAQLRVGARRRLPRAAPLSIAGDQILYDGAAMPLWGPRVGSASQNTVLRDKMLAALPDYKAQGLSCITVFLQGTSGARSRCFNAAGTSIDAEILSCTKAIADECEELGVLLILGIFYAGSAPLTDYAAYLTAVRTTATEFLPYRHVIVNIANEQNTPTWESRPMDMRTVENVLLCMDEYREIDPDRILGCGGYDIQPNIDIGLDPRCDVVLFDTGQHETFADHYDAMVAAGISKPKISVETFGGSTAQIHPTPGVYTDEYAKITAPKGKYIEDIDLAIARGSYSLIHDNRWFQMGNQTGSGDDCRFDFGPDGVLSEGTTASPGWGWWARYIQANDPRVVLP